MSDPANPTPTTPEQTPTPQPTPTHEPNPPPEPKPEGEEGSILTGKAEEKPAEGEASFDPEKITFPEGYTKDEALFTEFTTLAKEAGLTGPAAQKLVDMAAKQAKAQSDALTRQWDEQQQAWQAEIKADKDIGGDKWEGVRQTFATVANDPALSDPDFKDALIFTGAGNHPAIVRTLVKWAAALSEGKAVRGNVPGQTTVPQSLGQAFYPEGPHTGGPKLS